MITTKLSNRVTAEWCEEKIVLRCMRWGDKRSGDRHFDTITLTLAEAAKLAAFVVRCWLEENK